MAPRNTDNTILRWPDPTEEGWPEARIWSHNEYISQKIIDATNSALDRLTLAKKEDNSDISSFVSEAMDTHKKELASVISNRNNWNELLGHPPDQHPGSFSIAAEKTPGKLQYCPGSVTVWLKALPTQSHEKVCHKRPCLSVTSDTSDT